MHCKKINLTLTIPVEIWCETGVDQTTRKLVEEIQADHYDDGRYPYCYEQLSEAVSKIVKHGVEKSVLDYMFVRYGKEMHKTKNSECMRAYHETEKWMKSDFSGVHTVLEVIKASIEEIETKEIK